MKPLSTTMCCMMFVLVLVSGCQEKESFSDLVQGKGTPSGVKMRALLDNKQAPVKVVSVSRASNPVGEVMLERSLFSIKLQNLSDCPVTTLKGKFVFFAEDGRAIPDEKRAPEVVFSDALQPIPPESEIAFSVAAKDDKAVRGAFVIQQVVYKARGLSRKWDNPDYDRELAAAMDGEGARAR